MHQFIHQLITCMWRCGLVWLEVRWEGAAYDVMVSAAGELMRVEVGGLVWC